MSSEPLYLSIVVPCFNESENVFSTVAGVRGELDKLGKPYEILIVNDGSTDDTEAQARKCSQSNPMVRVLGYPVNAGRGRAIRTGLSAARGRFVCSIDADLSYAPKFILDLINALEEHPEVDFALGSPYAPGGRMENVPLLRGLVSRTANAILRRLMPGGHRTYTSVFRCYRREMIDDLVLEGDTKELHLEIVAKAYALGYRAVEVPAVLASRKQGRSKFKFRRTAQRHIFFGINERPMFIFGLLGLGMLGMAVLLGLYLLCHSLFVGPVAGRPLMQFTVFLGLAGLIIFAVGFIAVQNVNLRNELYKIKRQNVRLAGRLEELARSRRREEDENDQSATYPPGDDRAGHHP